MASLAKFCVALAQDPEAIRKFSSSRAAAREHMNRIGLSEEQQEILLSGDVVRIKSAMEAEYGPGSGGGVSVLHAMSLVMPTN